MQLFSLRIIALGLLLALLSACSSTTVKTTTVTPVIQGSANMPEAQLMDVGVELFDPGLENIKEDDVTTYPEVRQAEARYFPHHLMTTMQGSANWGAVRIVPANTSSVDITVAGKILHSDGEKLSLDIMVSDATGLQWFKRTYTGETSKYNYQAGRHTQQEPFQDVYNRIANDIAQYRQKLTPEQAVNIRSVAEMKFAEAFAPAAFGGYLEKNRKGIYELKRLPADSDPMMQRIQQIRERDYLFVDTLQDYYGTFVREMDPPYTEWRRNSYEEVLAYRELRNNSRMSAIAGAAAIIGGILAQGGDSPATRAAGQVAIIGGGFAIKNAIDKHSEAEIHAAALQELGASMSAEITPQVIKLDDRTVTLSGSAETQYQQWRGILREMYSAETGEPVSPPADPAKP